MEREGRIVRSIETETLSCILVDRHARGCRSLDLLRLWEAERGAAEKLFIYFLDFLLYRAAAAAAADTAPCLSLSLTHLSPPLPISVLYPFPG